MTLSPDKTQFKFSGDTTEELQSKYDALLQDTSYNYPNTLSTPAMWRKVTWLLVRGART